MKQNNEGLRAKYIVHKAETGEEVNNCFVLRPDRDAAAVTAIRDYAAVTENKTLAADLIRWVGVEHNDPLTLEQLREMDGEPVYFETVDNDCFYECGWAIVSTEYERIASNSAYFLFEDLDRVWIARRHKPSE